MAYRIAFADARLAPAPSKRNYPRSPLVNRLADASHCSPTATQLRALTAGPPAYRAFDGDARAPANSAAERGRVSPFTLPARWLDVHGIQDRCGKIRSAARWESKLTAQAVGMMDKLGMSPTSRAKLGLNLARTTSLAEATSEPNPQRRTELLRQAGVGGVDDV